MWVAYLTLASSSSQEYLAIFFKGLSLTTSTLGLSRCPSKTGSPPYIRPSPLNTSAPSVLKFFGAWA